MSQKISISLLALTLLTSASFVYADWKPPTATPPNENVAAPINVSGNAQDKAGVLTLGGLGVFGSALITSTGGYTLPSSLSLGVNGYVGAKGYCDEKGNNCVSLINSDGQTTTVNTTSSSAQILPGWPNALICRAGANFTVLRLFGVSNGNGAGINIIEGGYVGYIDWIGDPQENLIYNKETGDYVTGVVHLGTVSNCRKNIKDLEWAN
jgi:hypothetical protein